MDCDWKLVGLGVGVAGLVSVGCLYAGYRLGKSRGRSGAFAGLLVGKSHEKSNPLTAYIQSHNKEDAVLGKLRELSVAHRKGRMATPTDEGSLLTILVRALNARKVIDVGVFTGLSSFAMALGLPADGKVIACDISDEFTSIGKPYWEEGGVAGKIDLRLQPAVETLQQLIDNGESGTFDIVFIDADKENYGTYYQLGMELLRPGGLIAVDNALWSGRVADPSDQDPYTVAIRKVNQEMMEDRRVHYVLLNISDGLGIGQKLPPA